LPKQGLHQDFEIGRNNISLLPWILVVFIYGQASFSSQTKVPCQHSQQSWLLLNPWQINMSHLSFSYVHSFLQVYFELVPAYLFQNTLQKNISSLYLAVSWYQYLQYTENTEKWPICGIEHLSMGQDKWRNSDKWRNARIGKCRWFSNGEGTIMIHQYASVACSSKRLWSVRTTIM
jgi:hypothetical protein